MGFGHACSLIYRRVYNILRSNVLKNYKLTPTFCAKQLASLLINNTYFDLINKQISVDHSLQRIQMAQCIDLKLCSDHTCMQTLMLAIATIIKIIYNEKYYC